MISYTVLLDVPEPEERYGDDEHGVIVASVSEARPAANLWSKLTGRPR